MSVGPFKVATDIRFKQFWTYHIDTKALYGQSLLSIKLDILVFLMFSSTTKLITLILKKYELYTKSISGIAGKILNHDG